MKNEKLTQRTQRGTHEQKLRHRPEFGRAVDVFRLYGIKRGTAYNLLADRKIRGVLLHVTGNKLGIRLFDLASVRRFIRAQMLKDEEK